MLYIEGNKFNEVYTSVSPHKTISNPTYLMCLEHAQSGKRYSFIPQNVTSFTGSPYNNRYDLFRFKVSESGVNLTGGTRAWYWQYCRRAIFSDNSTSPITIVDLPRLPAQASAACETRASGARRVLSYGASLRRMERFCRFDGGIRLTRSPEIFAPVAGRAPKRRCSPTLDLRLADLRAFTPPSPMLPKFSQRRSSAPS